MKEVWKDIKGYEKLYQVSSLGNVRSLDKKVNCKNGYYRTTKGKLLKQFVNYKGYMRVFLVKNFKTKMFSVHRLVANTFLGIKENKKQVNHKNGIKTDNRVENLEWVSCKENIRHAIDNNLINYEYKNKKIIVIFKSIKQASEFLKIDRNIICTRLNKQKDYKGIYFKKWEVEYNGYSL